jgi:hypothetical protein
MWRWDEMQSSMAINAMLLEFYCAVLAAGLSTTPPLSVTSSVTGATLTSGEVVMSGEITAEGVMSGLVVTLLVPQPLIMLMSIKAKKRYESFFIGEYLLYRILHYYRQGVTKILNNPAIN